MQSPAFPSEVAPDDLLVLTCLHCGCGFDPRDPDLVWIHTHRPFGVGTIGRRLRLWLRRRATRALLVDLAFTVAWALLIDLQKWLGLNFWFALLNAFVVMRPVRTAITLRWGI